MLHLTMENLLKTKNLRVTPFRLEVLKVFQNHENAIELSVIEDSLVDFDRITLYRTVKAFIEAGLLHEILISGEKKKLALCAQSCKSEAHIHEHIHFLCVKCNETFCLEPIKMPEIKHASFDISSFEVQAKGVCENCIS
jgi:Fur family ferric uptake transcriptional regulator